MQDAFIYLFKIFLKFSFIWRIIALQCYFGFSHAAATTAAKSLQ